jgi:hypothetical protein
MDSEADFEIELIHHLESIGGTIIAYCNQFDNR